jgi:hypothetical protein
MASAHKMAMRRSPLVMREAQVLMEGIRLAIPESPPLGAFVFSAAIMPTF